MSLCDQCAVPGMCCREIRLSTSYIAGPEGTTALEALAWLAACVPSEGELGLPFLPLRRELHPLGIPLGWTDCPVVHEWVFSCPILAPDGRCGDYENRPNLCRTFEPGTDEPCAMTGWSDTA